MSSRLERLDARPSTCLVLLLACLAGPSRAQVPDFLCCRPGYEYCCVTRLEPGDVGVHHYAIENPATGEITQRGRAGSLGYLFPDGLLLPPETELRLWVVQARTLRVGSATFVSGRVGETFPLPAINLPLTTGDLDFDLLPDRAEWVLGTDPSEPDTDGDGVDDGQEIRNDTDPLDGVSRASGLLAIATTRNAALELCALDDLLIVAETDGLSVFNVFAAQSPRLLARLPLDDEPIDLTCGEGRARAAVVLPDQVVLVDLRDPAEPVLGDPIAAPGVSSAVLRGDLLHVDTKTIDLRDESVLQEAFVCSDELTWGGGFLLSWCETLDRVFVLDGPPGALSVIGSIVVPGSISGLDERRRLFAGLDHVLITDSEGFTRVDLSEPTAPRLDWRVRSGLNPIDIVGSSDDRLFVTAGPTGPDSLAVTSYDGEGTFEALFDSPGLPRRLLVHQGLVYAASGVDGVAILDVLPPEPADEGPTIELLTPTTGSRVLQGGALDVTARAEDDAQVRNVEIFAEGQRLGSDGSYPFEASFTAPAIVGDRLRVRARAFDRAGHATWSNELDLTLVPELDPPQLIGMTPALGERRLPAGTQVEAAFDEPLEPESIVDRITVQWSGPDNRLDTFDDATLAGSTRLTSDGRRLVFDPEAPLPAGVHRVTVEAGLSDRIGNVTAGPMQWTFELVDLPGCQLAPELSASEFTTIVQAGPSSFLPSCLGNPDQQAVTWYTFVGDGGDWQLSTCPSSGGLGSARFRVYSGGCDGLTCQADSGAQGSCGACPEGRGRRLRLCTEADIRYHVAVEGASVRFVLEPATGPVMACETWPRRQVLPIDELEVLFDGALTDDLGALQARLTNAGPDGMLDTTDDVVTELLDRELSSPQRLVLSLTAPLPAGRYRLDVSELPLTACGGAAPLPISNEFTVLATSSGCTGALDWREGELEEPSLCASRALGTWRHLPGDDRRYALVSEGLGAGQVDVVAGACTTGECVLSTSWFEFEDDGEIEREHFCAVSGIDYFVTGEGVSLKAVGSCGPSHRSAMATGLPSVVELSDRPRPRESPECNSNDGLTKGWLSVLGTGRELLVTTCAEWGGSRPPGGFEFEVYRQDESGALACVTTITDYWDHCPSRSGWGTRFCSEAGVEYFVELLSFEDASYRLAVVELDECRDRCEYVQELTAPAHVLDSTLGADRDLAGNELLERNPGCHGFDDPSPDTWFRVVGQGRWLTASTCPSNGGAAGYDLRLSIQGPGCGPSVCIARGEACPDGPGERATWCAQPDLPYVVQVDGHDGDSGLFELSIEEGGTCQVPTSCAAAKPLELDEPVYGGHPDPPVGTEVSCPETMLVGALGEIWDDHPFYRGGSWYRIIGTGSRLRASTCDHTIAEVPDFGFGLKVFRGSCFDLQCVGANLGFTFDSHCYLPSGALPFVEWDSEAGTAYWIFVAGDYGGLATMLDDYAFILEVTEVTP